MKNKVQLLLVTFFCYFILISFTGYYLYQNQTVDVIATDHNNGIPKQILPLYITELTFVSPVLDKVINYQTNGYRYQQPKNSEGLNYISLDNIESILDKSITFTLDEDEMLYHIEYDNREFQHYYGTDIGSEGYRIFPLRGGIVKENTDTMLISTDFLKYGIGYEVIEVNIDKDNQNIYVSGQITKVFGETQLPANDELPVSEWDYEKRLAHLEHLMNPIEGSHVSTRPSQWPGAPRYYRNGYHEGLDFYSHTSGIIVDKNTPVLAMDDGIVIRSDLGYIELSSSYRNQILQEAMGRFITPEYILDMLRGKSVWIEHNNGVVARYVHLDSIMQDVQVGEPVKRGQVIGKAGNTGTSYSLIGSDQGVHLHLDIMIHGQLFWESLTTEEIVALLQTLFND
ncbi:M23 family metallopeptidase [Desulfuribacillus alkaliarsenatis]|uniref:M23ase beta-sheet core domain-containing protein n=1 Tax=Desulfuribacillus alkaliarsenatis TaxID=766136 RepID=A0A1E5FZT5_9FIRM|nr:M23 family metallopeptidase [Desulfuribacillus alkaliarsenatis]OEF96040.1 hypothetical protein BHF68_09855 [Desulfuribacillus alkaliarsenatis]